MSIQDNLSDQNYIKIIYIKSEVQTFFNKSNVVTNHQIELTNAFMMAAIVSNFLTTQSNLAAIVAMEGISALFEISSKVQENETIVLSAWAKSTYIKQMYSYLFLACSFLQQFLVVALRSVKFFVVVCRRDGGYLIFFVRKISVGLSRRVLTERMGYAFTETYGYSLSLFFFRVFNADSKNYYYPIITVRTSYQPFSIKWITDLSLRTTLK